MPYPTLEARRAALVQCGFIQGPPPSFRPAHCEQELETCMTSDCRSCGLRTLRWEPWYRGTHDYVALFVCRLCGFVEEF